MPNGHPTQIAILGSAIAQKLLQILGPNWSLCYAFKQKLMVMAWCISAILGSFSTIKDYLEGRTLRSLNIR